MKRAARKFHRRVWLVLGLVLPTVVVWGLMIKQEPLGDRPAIQLEKPQPGQTEAG